VYNTYIIVNFFHDRADDLKVIPRTVISMIFFLVFKYILQIEEHSKDAPYAKVGNSEPFQHDTTADCKAVALAL
jgi:protoheme ferro-lyase